MMTSVGQELLRYKPSTLGLKDLRNLEGSDRQTVKVSSSRESFKLLRQLLKPSKRAWGNTKFKICHISLAT
jgi:hypothetical protein